MQITDPTKPVSFRDLIRWLLFFTVALVLCNQPAFAQEREKSHRDQENEKSPGQRSEDFGGPPFFLEQPLVLTPVAWNVIAKPIHPVKGTDGRIHLAYEQL